MRMKEAINGVHSWLQELIAYVTAIANGDVTAKMGFPHFASPASYPAAQKMSSEAMNLKASSMGRMVRPKGPALVQRSFHSDQ